MGLCLGTCDTRGAADAGNYYAPSSGGLQGPYFYKGQQPYNQQPQQQSTYSLPQQQTNYSRPQQQTSYSSPHQQTNYSSPQQQSNFTYPQQKFLQGYGDENDSTPMATPVAPYTKHTPQSVPIIATKLY